MDYLSLLPHIRLMFEITNPSLEDCWLEGYNQARTNTKHNPYKPGSSNHHHWEEGWWAGFYGGFSNNDENYYISEKDEVFDSPISKSKVNNKTVAIKTKKVNLKQLTYHRKRAIS